MVTLPQRRPYITALLLLVNLVVFLLLANEQSASREVLARFWVFPESFAVWNGARWTLLTAPFVHVMFDTGVIQLLFDLLLLWYLGTRLEWGLGREMLLALVFFGAILSSGAQLASGLGWPVVGATGIVYTLFGALLGTRKRGFLLLGYSPRQRLLLGLCFLYGFLASLLGLWPSGPVTPLAGLLFGLAAGWLLTERRWPWRVTGGLVIALLITITVLALTWAPWLPNWQLWRLNTEARAGQIDPARARLERLADTRNPQLLNGLAWLLATSPEDRLRDSPRAIALARQALDRTGHLDPSTSDTLAAAYAESGDWTQAEQTEVVAVKKAEELAHAFDRGGGEDEILAILRANLEKIKRHQPIREWPF